MKIPQHPYRCPLGRLQPNAVDADAEQDRRFFVTTDFVEIFAHVRTNNRWLENPRERIERGVFILSAEFAD